MAFYSITQRAQLETAPTSDRQDKASGLPVVGIFIDELKTGQAYDFSGLKVEILGHSGATSYQANAVTLKAAEIEIIGAGQPNTPSDKNTLLFNNCTLKATCTSDGKGGHITSTGGVVFGISELVAEKAIICRGTSTQTFIVNSCNLTALSSEGSITFNNEDCVTLAKIQDSELKAPYIIRAGNIAYINNTESTKKDAENAEDRKATMQCFENVIQTDVPKLAISFDERNKHLCLEGFNENDTPLFTEKFICGLPLSVFAGDSQVLTKTTMPSDLNIYSQTDIAELCTNRLNANSLFAAQQPEQNKQQKQDSISTFTRS